MGAVPDLPHRRDRLHGEPDVDDGRRRRPTLEAKPVGTGPFVFKDYKPGESFTATKNPNYWNKPYPYLDEIEFRVIPDALTRAAALEAGDVDIIHTDERRHHQEVPRRPDNFPMTEIGPSSARPATRCLTSRRRARR